MCIFWFMLTTFCNYSSCPKTISNLFYIRTFLISIMNLGGLTLFVGARVLLIGFRLMFITNKVQKIGYQNKSWNVYMQIYSALVCPRPLIIGLSSLLCCVLLHLTRSPYCSFHCLNWIKLVALYETDDVTCRFNFMNINISLLVLKRANLMIIYTHTKLGKIIILLPYLWHE